MSHERIFKESTGFGVATETDVDGATREEVDGAIQVRPGLHKVRLVYYSDGGLLKWEVDVFSDPVRMVMMEVEVPEYSGLTIETVDSRMPAFLRRLVLRDVTGLKEFSNASLAHTEGNLRPRIALRPEWLRRPE